MIRASKTKTWLVLCIILTTQTNKLIPKISGYGDYTRVYVQTHVFKIDVYKGSQWVLFVATVVFLYEYKGPLVYIENKYVIHRIRF